MVNRRLPLAGHANIAMAEGEWASTQTVLAIDRSSSSARDYNLYLNCVVDETCDHESRWPQCFGKWGKEVRLSERWQS